MSALTGAVLVTGTDTGVGKTIVTAAIAAAAAARGLRVAVLKPGQTGDDSDETVVRELAGPALVRTLVSYPDPLAPGVAARVSGLAPLRLEEVIDEVAKIAADHDLILVEGAGGLLVPMGPGWTVADLAVALGMPAVVVARPALGTLSHTALTMEALRRRGIAGYPVLGSWPAAPELVHRTNLEELPRLYGRVPEGAGLLEAGEFRRLAPGWLDPDLHGTADDQYSMM